MHFIKKNLSDFPEMAKEVGNLIVAWSFADAAIISVLSKISDKSQSVCAEEYYQSNNGFVTRANIAIRKLDIATEQYPWATRAINIVKQLKKLSDFRNQIVHGGWGSSYSIHNSNGYITNESIVVFDYRKDGDERTARYTPGDLFKHSSEVIAISTELFLTYDNQQKSD